MARIVLIRHGESVANAERRFTVGPFEPLTARGRGEAIAVGRAVRARFDPVALYTSPFVRALETARHLGGLLGLDPVVVEDLREQDFGELRGRSYGDYAGDPSAQGIGRWEHRPPGGETLLEVARRAGAALDALAKAHLGQEIVVVSHGAVMAALRGHAAGHYRAAPQPTRNCGGYVLSWRSGTWEGPEELELGA
ncbi:MAG TPA: histidine phosphatase family protein [Myxococcota bacterium]|jgi:probable phosphoglycerate mutase|nr:histidine phosphatase family protein [Myxococcota bacterium]